MRNPKVKLLADLRWTNCKHELRWVLRKAGDWAQTLERPQIEVNSPHLRSLCSPELQSGLHGGDAGRLGLP